MDSIQSFCEKLTGRNITELKHSQTPGIYNESLEPWGDAFVFMAKLRGEKVLVKFRPGEIDDGFEGTQAEAGGGKIKICPKTAKNAAALRQAFPFTRPANLSYRSVTFGCGDRLGIATPGQIKAASGYQLTPVLAQQSTRELNLTGRTFQSVVDDASWGVFQQNFKSGFGGDGDHLKNPAEIQSAIDAGMTMITMDLSEHIDNSIARQAIEEVLTRYNELPVEVRKRYVNRYLDKTFVIEGAGGKKVKITIGGDALARIVTTYHKAIEYAIEIYRTVIAKQGVSYEISIDETQTPTAPEAHWVVASELLNAGVEVFSMAPRFCGEFQKGIDYMGDHQQFDQEFMIHAAIADAYGYKLSIHSGSDKFSIFPTVGRFTHQHFHHKTSGTSWLQSMRLVAVKNPDLYRELHQFCLANYAQVKKFYHITENVSNVPDINQVKDEDLPELFDNRDLRQIIHVSYGLVLGEKDAQGGFRFRGPLFQLWSDEEEAYNGIVALHLKRHFEMLGIPRRG